MLLGKSFNHVLKPSIVIGSVMDNIYGKHDHDDVRRVV